MQFPLQLFVTTSVAVAVLVRAPLTPVTVKTLEPAVAVVAADTVNVDELAVAGFGLKVPAAPVPRPLTVSVTAEVNEVLVMVMV